MTDLQDDVLEPAHLTRSKVGRRNETLSAQLAKELGARIARGEFKPGDRLPSEHDLIAAYGVSRTVVREAVSSLKARGMVITRQGMGAFVQRTVPTATLTLEPASQNELSDIMHMLEVRIALEVEAAGLAAQRRTEAHLKTLRTLLDEIQQATQAGHDGVVQDRAFHVELLRAAGNPHFARLLEQLGTIAFPRSRIDLFAHDPVARTIYLQCLALEHENIYQAVLHQNISGARRAMRHHLSNSHERLRQSLASQEK